MKSYYEIAFNFVAVRPRAPWSAGRRTSPSGVRRRTVPIIAHRTPMTAEEGVGRAVGPGVTVYRRWVWNG